MFCIKCGYELTGEEVFCPKCGQKVDYKEEISEEVQEAEEEKCVEAVEMKIYDCSEDFFKEKLEEMSKRDDSTAKYYIAPDIPDKILINAVNKITPGIDASKILCVYDTTVMGSGKAGIVFTGSHLYIKGIGFKKDIDLKDLKDVQNLSEKHTDNKGRETTSYYTILSFENQEDIEIQSYNIDGKGYELLAILLPEFLYCVDEIDDKSHHYNFLSELGDEIIYDYLSIVCAYLKSDDGIIDAQEYKELISLMSRIKVSKELADKLRENRLNIDTEVLSFEEYVKKLSEEMRKEKRDTCTLYQSLFKDLLLMKKGSMSEWKEDASLCQLKELLDIKDEQVEVFIRSIELDDKIINERLEDNQVKDLTNEIIAIAGGAGVTLAALAVTGGVSTGIWGGLFALGAMSSGGMLLGLAAIGGLSYGAYKGIKYFSGTSELEKSGIRITALQESIECNKRSVTYIIEDVNYLTRKVSDLFEKISVGEANIDEELFAELSNYLNYAENVGKSGTLIEKNSQNDMYEVYIAKLPLDLAYNQFIELANNNVNGEVVKNYILGIYKKTEIAIPATSNENEENSSSVNNCSAKVVYRRPEELSYETAERAYVYFESIGLYETKEASVAHGKAILKSFLG